LSYIGLGEITLGIIFGPLLMQGVSIAAAGTTTVPGFIISCIVGILVINILYTHAVMDFEADRSIHKNTLAVVLNNQKWITFFSTLFIFSPFVLIVCFVLLNMLPPIFLITLWILPIAISLFRSILAFQKDPSSPISRRWYHFPMERWKEITRAGIDWFMLRWYSARNLVLFFCLTYVGIALFYTI
jgi:1,4-dihydroxy-2-naphthoate octaprenyltransferase